jgi:O-acetyl-ADP-ribose deacetylase (regulator of RNase III)
MTTKQTQLGDITSVSKGIIIHQVNAQGLMGSGVALALRRRYPSIFDDYAEEIKPRQPNHASALYMGRLIMSTVGENLRVAQIVGQQFCGSDGLKYTSYDALDAGLTHLADWIETRVDNGDMPAPHIHYPLIGAGLGGGNWEVIEQIIAHRLARYERTLWRFM